MDRLCIAICASLTFVSWPVSSDEVVLWQKPECSSASCVWTWTVNPITPTGWRHLSLPKNYYITCDVNSLDPEKPNNWLRSDVIPVREGKSLDVTVEYLTFPCQDYQPRTFCNESFSAYVWEANTTIKIPDPTTSYSSYRRFATFNRQGNPAISSVTLNVNSKFIVLGFQDEGGCRRLYSVKVSYDICVGKTLKGSLVSLPQTLPPLRNLPPIPVDGNCTANSVQAVQGTIAVLCESSGEWNTSLLEGRCVCEENRQNVGGICNECSLGTYNDGKGFNCTVTPSEPRDAVASSVTNISAVISWSPPATIGTETDVLYDIECQKSCDYYGKSCDDEECEGVVSFLFQMEKLNMTNITITNLPSFVNYTCKISAKNRVSKVAERNHGVKANFALVNLRTNGTAPGKPEVAVHLAEDGTIELSWKLKCKNGIIEGYRVTYVRMDESSDTETLKTKNKEVRIKSLMSGKTYKFRVFALNNFGTGPPGVKTFKIPNGSGGSLGLSPKSKAVIAGAAGGGALLLIIILVVVIVFVCRFRRRSPRSIQKDYMRTLEQGLGSDLPMDQRRYIDPGNYLDLMELLTTFTSEIDRSKTKLEGMIGQGEFADVYKGTLQTSKEKKIVAVKVLRPGSNEKNQKDFLAEASIMGQFHHPNVIELIGVVTQSRPMMILTEFLESGSLDHFLKNRNGQLTVFQLLGMARGVACGMVYLAEMNFIHRDLAARNILVGENMSCKVSDFGLSRELSDDTPDSEYETQGGKIPVRWTAPEALQHRKFSSASDVWSYGILLWEIMSFSDRPYWDWNNYDVINRVETGYRLPPPTGCSKVVHGLMLECWESDKNKRPKFADIVIRLDELFRFPEVLNDNLLSVTNNSEKEAPPEFQSVDEWLKFINMEKYVDVFHAADINNLENVARLRDSDLRAMGISLIGHRNKMNKSIRSMNTHFVNRGLDIDEAAI